MTPAKPFPSYKWRWLSLEPSEGLLKAPVFLGVLRVLSRHVGETFNSQSVFDDLSAIQIDLKEVLKSRSRSLTLARDMDRNVVRNSGQYWRGTGLLSQDRGVIALTDLGSRVASGAVTQGEFAALMVQQTVLPNPATYSSTEMQPWEHAGLQIRPLKLILQIIEQLGRYHGGPDAAWLNRDELTGVIIPLAGASVPVAEISQHVARYRTGKLDVSEWPNCVPSANDKRLAREFLLFLAYFGLLRLDTSQRTNATQRFRMDELFDVDAVIATTTASIFDDESASNQAVEDVRHSPLPSIIERQRVLTRVFARTGQARFRSRIMTAYQGRCFLTGETIPEVLEAAHIVPVTSNGADEDNNGFCMRVDIHRLYDSGNLRIRPDGTLMLSEAVANSPNYATLPQAVVFPPFVNPVNVAWRNNYL